MSQSIIFNNDTGDEAKNAINNNFTELYNNRLVNINEFYNEEDDVVSDRCNLISICNSYLDLSEATNIIHFEEATQTIKNLIYDNLYVKDATAVTNGTATNTLVGGTIFD